MDSLSCYDYTQKLSENPLDPLGISTECLNDYLDIKILNEGFVQTEYYHVTSSDDHHPVDIADSSKYQFESSTSLIFIS